MSTDATWVAELGTDGPSVVLVAADGSETAMNALAFAFGLARRNRARLEVVTVSSTSTAASLSPGAAAALIQTEQEIGSEVRARIEASARELGVATRVWERTGDPFSEIVSVADEVRPDVVLVGASQQATHRLIGSIAVRLVKLGRWPVTVVP
ncbi:MAG TPA: universal stress protein [Mycobacteriales bacterium]|nr:universal stress protein [Mycobacteriales bacterium]